FAVPASWNGCPAELGFRDLLARIADHPARRHRRIVPKELIGYLAFACASIRYTVLTSFAPVGGVGFSSTTIRIPSRSRQRMSAPSLTSGFTGVSRTRSNISG